MSINPRQAVVLGKDEGNGNGNPLVMLANAIAQNTGVLEQIAKSMPAKHVYQLHPAGPNQWMVYCNGCSESLERYVWPCQHATDEDPIPPSGFTTDEAPSAPSN